MNELIKNVNRQLEAKRTRNTAIAQSRKQEVYDGIPQIKAIDVEMAKIVKEMISALANNANNAPIAAKEVAKIGKSFVQKKRQLLQANNLPADYLDPIHDCSNCQDSGYLEDGSRCTCFKAALIDLAYRNSDLRNKLKKENFDTFKLNIFSDSVAESEALSPRQNMANTVETAMSFIANFAEKNQENLLFYGDTGQGKTFLCSCIAKALIDSGYHVIYQTAYKLFDTVKDYRFSDSTDAKTRYHLLTDCDLLIIDDLGTELINTLTHAELFNLINVRLLKQKKTIISTNLYPEELPTQYDERTSSRIIGYYKLLRFMGDDLRLNLS